MINCKLSLSREFKAYKVNYSSEDTSLADTLTNFFTERGIAPELVVFIISLMPILELRGGLIAAAILNISPFVAVPICIIGNLLPIPFVLLFIRKIFNLLKRNKRIAKWVEKLEARTRKKGSKLQTGKIIGLIIFVGIPLPGTGAWTGALAADIFDIRFRSSMPAIAAGVVLASAIMLTLTYLIPGLFGFSF